MALTPEIEARGMRAYEQARAFERLRSWRLPLTYAVVVLIPALCGAGLWVMGYATMAGLNFGAAVVLAWIVWSHWKKLHACYAENLQLLAELKTEYGDELPWIQVENHFAALALLRRAVIPEENSKATPEK